MHQGDTLTGLLVDFCRAAPESGKRLQSCWYRHSDLMSSGQKYPPNGHTVPLQTITSPGILLKSSPLSALFHFWGRSAEPREGNILGLCVYLGRFHCREPFFFFFKSRLLCAFKTSTKAAALRVCCRQENKKKGLLPSSNASATNIWSDNKRQRRLSQHNPSSGITYFSTLGSCSKMASTRETQPTAQKHKSLQKTVRFHQRKHWEHLWPIVQNDFLLMRSLFLK